MKKWFILILILCLILPVEAAGKETVQSSEAAVLMLVNRERIRQGMEPLTMTDALQEAARTRSEELLERFENYRPFGDDCYSIFRQKRVPCCFMGENIAAGYTTPTALVRSWLRSDPQRNNILNPHFVHIGIGEAQGYGTALSGWGSHWAQEFSADWDCGYTGMNLLLPEHVRPGSSVDQFGIWAELWCSVCGRCYLPVMEEFCQGYDPKQTGPQLVTVTVLGHRAAFLLDGDTLRPAPTPENPFLDVKKTDFFYEPVIWAYESEVASGRSVLAFEPRKFSTRGEMIVMLWRTLGSPMPTYNETFYIDVRYRHYYYWAVGWAREQGIVLGVRDDLFGPSNLIKRGDLLTILWRAAGSPEPEDTEIPFTDIELDEYHTQAILWAWQNSIAQGVSPTSFQPNRPCTRGEAVTFLYRARSLLRP